MSIPEGTKKINIIILLVIIIVLGLFLAFGGFKLAVFAKEKQPIRVVTDSIVLKEEGTAPVNQSSKAQQVVASKTGSKYHLLTCPGAKTIIEKNRVYFDSAAAAELSGYEPAGNCPGLKK